MINLHDQFKDIMKCMLTFAIALYSESRLSHPITEKKERRKALISIRIEPFNTSKNKLS
jgi:hypothetical protein